MTKKVGAKQKLLAYFLDNVGTEIPREELEYLCKGSSWPRSVRLLRDDGWVYVYNYSKKTYCFPYSEPRGEKKDSRHIPQNIKAMVMLRDQSTCQMCGRSVKDDHIVIHLDHIIPHSWGGETKIENLQCLCKDCNEGKKNWVTSENPDLMRKISEAASAGERLKHYFNFYPNRELTVSRLRVIAKTRDWTRQIREIRAKYGMNIVALRAKKDVRNEDCYIYYPDKEEN